MRRNFDDVLDMHRAHGLPVGDRPALLEPGDHAFRRGFLQEELEELDAAYEAGDLAAAADALVDLVVVALGTAVWMGLPWQALWDEVHRANMAKERGQKEGRKHSRDAIDLIKPPGWRAPDVEGVLSGEARGSRFPKIVCLCGSTRFYREYQVANFEQTMAGNIVLSVGFYPHSEEHHEMVGLTKAGYPEDVKEDLDELHKRKIDLADEVLILNIGGYVGESTRSEIEYAEARGKPVRYWEAER